MPGFKPAPRITVLGVGNTLMGDDGVGVAVARGLVAELEDSPVSVVLGETAGMGLMRHFRESDVVIVIDAVAAEAEAGSIFRFNADEADIVHLRSNNIHGMGVPHLISNARLVGADPEVIVFGVQVGDVRPRDEVLTEPVAAAVPRVRALVIDELVRFGAARP
ncbi:MAG: hydrogenase maturation protease [Actinobacteria bacterium]|nr:hydrogenase maturation protease [Actinomycetota bacterium]